MQVKIANNPQIFMCRERDTTRDFQIKDKISTPNMYQQWNNKFWRFFKGCSAVLDSHTHTHTCKQLRDHGLHCLSTQLPHSMLNLSMQPVLLPKLLNSYEGITKAILTLTICNLI
ncbi:hypothetical protein CEXT_99761 [Caerostris extrusa]|uniref:Uncharacterized protein n=1 Tax=Caerostris extrusa TaxID=172846 RepID=A0AAV4SU59_CAEEX|nr:hypothetical protein CEXT_99761 [Caerostris extrusa]